MSNMLRSPSVGPVVGHTTSHASRIWMRGSDEVDGRSIGVAALYDADGNYVAKSACYLRLHREYDRTGTVDFTGLNPDTTYFVRLGSLTFDSTNPMVSVDDSEVFNKLPDPETFCSDLEKLPHEESLARFTTYPVAANNGLSFIFGSCRYPGLFWAAKKSDKIFGAILEKFNAANAPRFLLMVGDQIYADKLGRWIPFFRADTPAEFQERYITAFTSPNMRTLLRSVPTYMILDDHEIENDWTPARMEGDERNQALYQAAISAYKNYQWMHSPRNYCRQDKLADISGDKFYYSFDCGGYPFFVMDSRTQRIKNEDDCNLDNNHLLGYPSDASAHKHRAQINILCDWLVLQQKQTGSSPKFIVSPDTFVPNGIATAGNDDLAQRKKCENDSWPAFSETRRQLLQAIVDSNIQNVVFLCGDAHSSCVAEINFTHKTNGILPLRALSITSSAFYWPWFNSKGDQDSFVHDSAKDNDHFDLNDDVVMNYRAYAFVQENNFTRIEVTRDEIIVQNYDREGNALGGNSKLRLAHA